MPLSADIVAYATSHKEMKFTLTWNRPKATKQADTLGLYRIAKIAKY